MHEIQQQLCILADPDYQKFLQRLIPNVPNILGIRLPKLIKLAKQIAKEFIFSDKKSKNFANFDSKWENFWKGTANNFDSVMLQGLVIGYSNISLDQRFRLIESFLPKIDNWAVCDTFCGSLKIKLREKTIFWEFLQKIFQSNHPFSLRFVLIISYKFVDESHLNSILSMVTQIHSDHRYVKLAVARLIAECCVFSPGKIILLLKSKILDPSIQNAAIRKIVESLRIDENTKMEVRQSKRLQVSNH